MCTIMCSFPINYCCSRPRHGPVQPRQQRQPTAHLAHRWPFEARNPIIRLLRVLVQLLNRLYDLRCQISLCPITGIKHIIWAHVCTVQCCCHAAPRADCPLSAATRDPFDATRDPLHFYKVISAACRDQSTSRCLQIVLPNVHQNDKQRKHVRAIARIKQKPFKLIRPMVEATRVT